MQRKHNPSLLPFAKALRKNMTPEEKHLWYNFLSIHPARFKKQKIIGSYIADFYCAEAKLVIELDGNQHGEEQVMHYDALRTLFLEKYDLTVIRIPNQLLKQDFESVCRYLNEEIQKRTGHTAF